MRTADASQFLPVSVQNRGGKIDDPKPCVQLRLLISVCLGDQNALTGKALGHLLQNLHLPFAAFIPLAVVQQQSGDGSG